MLSSFNPRSTALALAGIALSALPALVRPAPRLHYCCCVRRLELTPLWSHLSQAQEWTEDNWQTSDPNGPYYRRPM
jgi:hypothetical protein